MLIPSRLQGFAVSVCYFGELTPVFDTSAKDKRWETDNAEAFGGYFNFGITYIIILKYLQCTLKIYLFFKNKVYTFALNQKNSPFWLFGVHSQTIKTNYNYG
mgnify:CR=1 FL=1